MSTLTSRLGLYKPAADGSELVNVVTDINNNFDSIDAKMGAFACTSGTRPGSPFNGQMIRETDTGKMMLWNGAAWKQVLYDTAAWANPLVISGGDVSATAGAFLVARATGTSFDAKVTGDTQSRWSMDVNGSMQWGPGGVTAWDTNLYRASASLLKTDDSLDIVGNLNIGGITGVGDLNVSGSLNVGSARLRPILSTVTTLANSVAETAVATLTIPASDAVVGAVYKITVRALASVTGTPTLTLRARIGGVAGALITTSTGIVLSSASGGTNHPWYGDLYYTVTATGGAGTSRGFLLIQDTLSLGGNIPFTGVRIGIDGSAANVTHDTTASKDLVITAQWSAASASNTTTVFVADCERVA